MAKDKAQMDNLTLLTRRQGDLSRKIRDSIQGKKDMDNKTWSDIVDYDIPPATPAGLSPRTRKALEDLSGYNVYNVRDNLQKFYWLLYDDFEASRKEYMRKGWVTQEPEEPLVRSTMAHPQEVENVIGDVDPEEEDDDE